MSTPFPLEERGQLENLGPGSDPWNQPDKPSFGSGWGFTEDTAYLGPIYRIAAMPGSAVAKGELLVSGLGHGIANTQSAIADATGWQWGKDDAERGHRYMQAMEDDAKSRLRALTPDPRTTGSALQVIHGLGEGVSAALTGNVVGGAAGAASVMGLLQGYSAYTDLRDEGVTPKAAAAIAGIRGAFAGAGVVVPMTFGATLATRLGTSIAANVGFGVARRTADSAILRTAGYPEMAEQEHAFDRAQMITDAVLGAGFGAFAHISEAIKQHAESVRDAALTTNLALADRRNGPGVPTTPEDAVVHQRALETAVNQLQDGERVNVAGTGVEESSVVTRDRTPLVYHGTNSDFENFSRLEGEKFTGYWFSENPEYAGLVAEAKADPDLYGTGAANVRRARLDITNPATIEQLEREGVDRLSAQGYDGAYDPQNRHWVAFDNKQITNAIGELAASMPESKLAETKVEPARAEPATANEFEAHSQAADEILADRPGLQIPGEDGEPMLASTAKSAVDAERANVEATAPTLFKAMADCFLRNGAA